MYCINCGKEIGNLTEVCPYCGFCERANLSNQESLNKKKSKTAMGVLMAIVLGIWGIIVGLLAYNKDDYERETFIKGWAFTLVIFCVASFLLMGLTILTVGVVVIIQNLSLILL
jgi:hypothetical protein